MLFIDLTMNSYDLYEPGHMCQLYIYIYVYMCESTTPCSDPQPTKLCRCFGLVSLCACTLFGASSGQAPLAAKGSSRNDIRPEADVPAGRPVSDRRPKGAENGRPVSNNLLPGVLLLPCGKAHATHTGRPPADAATTRCKTEVVTQCCWPVSDSQARCGDEEDQLL